MATIPAAPVEALAAVREAEGRLLDVVAGFDDAFVAGPSLLPGWTVGHLITHLARNADSHTRRTAAAIGGVMVDQYPGGMEQRNGEIEAGAGRGAGALHADLTRSSDRLLAAWADVPDRAWANVTRDGSGRERRLDELPSRRWLEVEVHLVDLDCGVTHRDWPDAFVEARLPEMRAGSTDRLAAGDALPGPGTLDPRDELAWLYGRLERDDLPALGPWS
jgi:maleylpyruvate isomerase